MIAVLTLILGLLIGYYCRSVYEYVKNSYDMLRERFDAHQAGVVKPEVSRVTRKPIQEIDLTSDTGGIMRPTPDQILTERMKERNEKIKARNP